MSHAGKNPLEVTLAGNGRSFTLQNPIMTASGTFGFGFEFEPYGDLNVLGGIVVKGLSLEARDGNPMPRIADSPSGMLNCIGLQNPGAKLFLRGLLPRLAEKKAAIIPNLYATTLDEFATLAEMLTVDGVTALEVNVSCPNVKDGGTAFGHDPVMAAKVTETVVKNTSLPVIVKLSPNVTDIGLIAKACEDAGATALSCINTVRGMAVDARRRRSYLSNIIGGLSGPAIKPVGLRCVWEVTRAVDIPVIGVGGITTAQDVLEYILVGATAIQVGTGSFVRPDTAFSLTTELPELMKQFGIESLDEYRGSLRV